MQYEDPVFQVFDLTVDISRLEDNLSDAMKEIEYQKAAVVDAEARSMGLSPNWEIDVSIVCLVLWAGVLHVLGTTHRTGRAWLKFMPCAVAMPTFASVLGSQYLGEGFGLATSMLPQLRESLEVLGSGIVLVAIAVTAAYTMYAILVAFCNLLGLLGDAACVGAVWSAAQAMALWSALKTALWRSARWMLGGEVVDADQVEAERKKIEAEREDERKKIEAEREAERKKIEAEREAERGERERLQRELAAAKGALELEKSIGGFVDDK